MSHLNPEPVEIPPEYPVYLLEWFWDLSNMRPGGFGDVEAIQPHTVESWSRLTGVSITPTEYDVISELDSVFRRETREIRRAEEESRSEASKKTSYFDSEKEADAQ